MPEKRRLRYYLIIGQSWDSIFSLQTGMTSMQGPLAVGGGGVPTVEYLIIR